MKISEGGVERTPESLARAVAVNLQCVGDNYYWASRENKEMVKIELGAFATYIALDGSGYVRVILPGMKAAIALAEGATGEKFDYVEHLLVGLRSVTYYGASQ